MQKPSDATILVVEDNEDILELIESSLGAEGYTLLTATDGKAGLELFKENPDIDLVFTDLVLPGGMSGLELTKIIAREKPETLFLLGSGYPQKGETVNEKIQSRPNISYLSKPYDLDEMIEEVRLLLGTAKLKK